MLLEPNFIGKKKFSNFWKDNLLIKKTDKLLKH